MPESKSSDSVPPVHMRPKDTHATVTFSVFQSNVKGVASALSDKGFSG
ncbi:hypothetical protein SGPA1_30055 [Streptomyces misionensis JCM 4497]